MVQDGNGLAGMCPGYSLEIAAPRYPCSENAFHSPRRDDSDCDVPQISIQDRAGSRMQDVVALLLVLNTFRTSSSVKMLLSIGFLATVLLLLLHNSTADILGCDFYDTVNISSAEKLSNGSYLFEGLLIPTDLVDEYSFKVLADGSKLNVGKHMRGCVCKLKPCIRFCCPFNYIMKDKKCAREMSPTELESHNRYVNVTLGNGTVAKRHYKEDLIVQSEVPFSCDDGGDLHHADHSIPGNNFTMFENETFFRAWDEVYLNKRDYCMQHFKVDENIRIVPHFCLPATAKGAQSFVMMISLVCIVLTISVYLYIKQLHNLYGKCVMCYMVCLFMTFLILLMDLWNVFKLKSTMCITAGFLGYFFVMAAFFWLSVISLHLWSSFRSFSISLYSFLPEHLFLAYSCFSWGMALAMTGVTILADNVIKNADWAPRVGTSQCWIYASDYTVLLYFYGPMILLIVFNITMFILTSKQIVRVKMDVGKLNSDKRTYTMFLRLFIVMGASWSLEILSFFVSRDSFWSRVLSMADYFNWSQGTIIFVLFILKSSTLKLLRDR
ncbi:probable G-protein coupled receptor Mth-like 3 [Drosophila biarmipes]|uniref:probable G-protein coupled receptor Mth-like 3 n=1 Tax=Drosophila biarmipes TaxID=125945 RepID=UPI001CDAD904|nr:probable G-protein coupled receptor Mth-like 3 [Drosophila biarmipes]